MACKRSMDHWEFTLRLEPRDLIGGTSSTLVGEVGSILPSGRGRWPSGSTDKAAGAPAAVRAARRFGAGVGRAGPSSGSLHQGQASQQQRRAGRKQGVMGDSRGQQG
jgi:hypothetical protein